MVNGAYRFTAKETFQMAIRKRVDDLDWLLVVSAIEITAAPIHVETDVYLISGVNPKDRRDDIIY